MHMYARVPIVTTVKRGVQQLGTDGFVGRGERMLDEVRGRGEDGLRDTLSQRSRMRELKIGHVLRFGRGGACGGCRGERLRGVHRVCTRGLTGRSARLFTPCSALCANPALHALCVKDEASTIASTK